MAWVKEGEVRIYFLSAIEARNFCLHGQAKHYFLLRCQKLIISILKWKFSAEAYIEL